MKPAFAKPESTYRVQFHAAFTFDDARRIVPYLHSLGITHLYASPILKARSGSTHGYDIVDHNQLNPELGGEAAFARLSAALKHHGMGLVLDTVPNHMGVGTNDNALWNDVLEHGRSSRYADFFDIAWDASPHARGKLLIPVLADHYGTVVDRGDLRILREGNRPMLAYFDRRFPLNPSGDAASPEALDELIRRQHYRLAYWRTAADEINYRRFFDINDLAALRMERQEVFDFIHRLTLDLVHRGDVQGLRIDHADGLGDPAQYFARLREDGVEYVVAEKILGVEERLVEQWPINGTSGYDAMAAINGLFVDGSAEAALTSLHRQFTGQRDSFADTIYRCKLLILTSCFASELQMLALELDEIAQSDRHTQDFTFFFLKETLRQMIACFPVYRSYINSHEISQADRKYIDIAVSSTLARNSEMDPAAPNFIRSLLLQQAPCPRDRQLAFTGRFQQLTAPITAKGVEDTAFYRYHRLISLNEVGSDPSRFCHSPEALHAFFRHRQEHWPYALTPLSTHDAKRSEDVRARINVLSEIPEIWKQHVLRWRELNSRHRTAEHPTPSDEYLLYQTLVGAWPLNDDPQFPDRIKAYLRKAAREAKLSTSWTGINERYEASLAHFVDGILDRASGADFLASFSQFHARIAWLGAINSLAQSTLRLTCPGVPDTYQGTELWDFSLVDPDNRRPVDYALRETLLARIDALSPSEVLANWRDGAIKLLVTSRLLRLRRQYPGLFTQGQYSPIDATHNTFAFARKLGQSECVVIVPRLLARTARDISSLGLSGQISPTPRPYTDILTLRAFPPAPQLAIADLLYLFPVAVLLGT